MFTANIVERFSHPNKIEAQERKGGGRWEGSVYPKVLSSTGCRADIVQWFGGCCQFQAPAVDGPPRACEAARGCCPTAHRAARRARGTAFWVPFRFEVLAKVTRWVLESRPSLARLLSLS